MIRRSLLVLLTAMALCSLPAAPAEAKPAPYETGWPDNCWQSCVFPLNVSSIHISPRSGRTAKLTMRVTCSPDWTLDGHAFHGFLPDWRPRIEFDIDQPGIVGGGGATWAFQNFVCDGRKHVYTHLLPSGPGHVWKGGKARVHGEFFWASPSAPYDSYSYPIEKVTDYVRVKRP